MKNAKNMFKNGFSRRNLAKFIVKSIPKKKVSKLEFIENLLLEQQKEIIKLNSILLEQNMKLDYLGNKIDNIPNFEDKPRLHASHALCVYNLHQKTFGGYKNIYQGKDVVLLGSGPSLHNYQPIEGAITVGVNKTFLFDKVYLDYLFMHDYQAVKNYIGKSENYKNPYLKRFYGGIIPESIVIRHNASRYYQHYMWDLDYKMPSQGFPYDIMVEALNCYGSVVYAAMQFILYTNPKRIYIVGCDCAHTGYFDYSQPTVADNAYEFVRRGWVKLKEFAEMYYPETEIISINPVGLKGLFTDVYTEAKVNI